MILGKSRQRVAGSSSAQVRVFDEGRPFLINASPKSNAVWQVLSPITVPGSGRIELFCASCYEGSVVRWSELSEFAPKMLTTVNCKYKVTGIEASPRR